jgi:RHS repeat-associated protein
VRLGREPLARVTEGGTTFYGTDALGSVTVRLPDRPEPAGASEPGGIADLEYRAFGETREGDLTAKHPYGYTGKPVDPQTGIYDYGFRDYAPQLARFTSVDPVKDGPNWYAYVSNDPINRVDRLGLFWNFVVGGAAGFVSGAAGEVAANKDADESWGEAISETARSGESWAVIGATTALGAATSGTSAFAARAAATGARTVAGVAGRRTAATAATNAVGAAGQYVATKSIHGEELDAADAMTMAAMGGATAGVLSAAGETARAATGLQIVRGVSRGGKPVGTRASVIPDERVSGAASAVEEFLPAAQDVRSVARETEGADKNH